MAKFNWRALIGTVAPTLGAALGGPLGGMAGSLIAKTVLGKEKATDAELSTALANATPEQLLELKKADQAFAVQMKQLDVDIFTLETADTQSARKLFTVDQRPQMWLSALFVGGYFVVLWFYLSGRVAVAPDMETTVTTLMGIMSASVVSIMHFWFGSTFGSREKTAALAASQPATTA